VGRRIEVLLDRGLDDNRWWSKDLAILHDALLDPGCDNQDILDHLRCPAPHVRPCWVLDLLLGRL
jgi:hypothetical protein